MFCLHWNRSQWRHLICILTDKCFWALFASRSRRSRRGPNSVRPRPGPGHVFRRRANLTFKIEIRINFEHFGADKGVLFGLDDLFLFCSAIFLPFDLFLLNVNISEETNQFRFVFIILFCRFFIVKILFNVNFLPLFAGSSRGSVSLIECGPLQANVVKRFAWQLRERIVLWGEQKQKRSSGKLRKAVLEGETQYLEMMVTNGKRTTRFVHIFKWGLQSCSVAPLGRQFVLTARGRGARQCCFL